jgi:hypothetical protein
MNKSQKPKTPVKKPYRKRYLFSRNLHDVLVKATQKMVDKRGHVFAVILKNWPEIIGETWAKDCLFSDIKFPSKQANTGTLYVIIAPHLQAELPYMAPLILEKCASCLGYKAIEKIVALPAKRDTTSS